jgi:AraC-like DNA-binding protein
VTAANAPRGVLNPADAAGRFELLREDPAEDLSGYVEFHWIVRWDLRGRPPHLQKVLSHPNVHLVFEEPEPTVYGVQRGVFERQLEGRGMVHGVKFRPGAFRPLLGGPVLDLVDRTVPAADLFGPAVIEVQRPLLGGTEVRQVAEMARIAEDFLRDLLPEPDLVAGEVAGIVARITDAPSLFRVDDLAAELGLSMRSLQRLFAEYVGASPKWVLRRARLHEAAARAEQEDGMDWAALAADLGYSDQAHLTRDFTAAVGVPPARYARA